MLDQHLLEKTYDMILAYLPKLALAIITLLIGLWLIKYLVRFINRIMAAKDVDESLRPFFKTLVTVLLRVMLFISVMGMIGIEMTSFIALLGAAGIAIGMALSGSLQHFAGGVLLLIYKPFKKGDLIEAQDHKGIVKELRIFNTVLNTVDNKVVFIPNGPLSTGTIVNYSTEDTRRIDLVFGISYSDDIDKAKEIIQSVVLKQEKLLQQPEIFLGVKELGDSSVNIELKVWTSTDDIIDMEYYLNESVKKEFDKGGITIPFPQMDVHMRKE